jgi:geranylgeranyl pyrophosphate synthase
MEGWPEMQQVLLRGVSEEKSRMLALPCISCQAVGGAALNAIPVSVATVALRQAARFIDAVHDNDNLREIECESPSEAISLAIALIFTSFHCLGLATKDGQRSQRLVSLVSEATFLSAQGQYLGLMQDCGELEREEALETCWRMVITRSGGLFRISTAGGAAVGTDSEQLVDALGEYGTCLGVMLQLIDDCRDIPEDWDSSRRAVSLPLILLSMSVGDELAKIPIAPLNSDDAETRQAVYETLYSIGVPHVISDVLLEWQDRAFKALEPLGQSDAVAVLKRIAQEVLVFDS